MAASTRRHRIRTPELQVYAVAVVAVLCVSSGSLAGIVQQRFFRHLPNAFLALHVAVMAAVSTIALLAVELPTVTSVSAAALAGLPLGAACGVLAAFGEVRLKRWARRSRRPGRAVLRRVVVPASAAPQTSPVIAGATAVPRRLRSVLALLALAAALEEVVFRGVAVDLSHGVPSSVVGVGCIAVATALFALSHLPLGWPDVVSKVPLGVVALAMTLAFGSIIPAVAAHIVFNAAIWRTLPG